MKKRSSKRAKACDITKKVREEVWERDEHCCILCGSNEAMPNSHYIPRSLGGLGIPQNVVTMCRECHDDYEKHRREKKSLVAAYLKKCYPNWDEGKLVFKKYDWEGYRR